MNKKIPPLFLLPLILVTVAVVRVHAAAAPPAAAGSYKLTDSFRVGGQGSWDFLTVDPQTHLLYVPRVTHTMVIDAVTGKLVADISGQKASKGVAIVPKAGRGFISDDDTVVIFDLKTNKVLGKIKVEEDADGITYDEASDKVLVGCEDGAAVFAIAPTIDPKSGKATELKVGGRPELIAPDGQGKAYVALKDKNQVAVIDTKLMKVLNRWSTAPGGEPVGMGIDREHRRLFVGCRNPAKLVVINVDDGKVIASLPLGTNNDGIILHGGNIFASCSDGTISVVRETSPSKFETVDVVKTKLGAKTMGFDPSTETFYLPTAEFDPPSPKTDPVPKSDSFMILVVRKG